MAWQALASEHARAESAAAAAGAAAAQDVDSAVAAACAQAAAAAQGAAERCKNIPHDAGNYYSLVVVVVLPTGGLASGFQPLAPHLTGAATADACASCSSHPVAPQTGARSH